MPLPIKRSLKNVNNSNTPMRFRHWKPFIRGRMPGQVIIQYTDQCNASCAQCGMRRENRYPRSTLDMDQVKRSLEAMAERGVSAVSFTGGEPLLYLKEISECISYAKQLGIDYVRTGTNGFMFQGYQKPNFQDRMAKLADTLLEAGIYTFWISIDSASAEIHEQNRGLNAVIPGIEKGLPIFHERGLYPSVNLGINRYLGGFKVTDCGGDWDACYEQFREGFRNFYSYVDNLGFTIVNSCYPMDFDSDQDHAVYTATAVDDFVRFTRQEKLALFQALYDVIPEFRHRLRIFTPRSSLRALIQHYRGQPDDSYACRGGIDFFFVDSKDMNTYPCGFRGEENLGKFWDLDLNKLDSSAWCKQCDWECFRDPSELLGPFLEARQQPWQWIKKMFKDRELAKLWYKDLRYYQACDYFNAQLPPNKTRLARFAPTSSRTWETRKPAWASGESSNLN